MHLMRKDLMGGMPTHAQAASTKARQHAQDAWAPELRKP
ncbi:hypothetical protein URH17368_2841 [Alicyclobacillus hesperidum URH17-3-68]|nr:hypothetical protein URH17368_2841 [Alicyclobacillus hesperidum URH17-3-68]